MMAEPMAPGRGLPVYQPATEVVDGTWSAPPEVRPRLIKLVCTPISGMVSDTGAATGRGPGDCRTATIGPVGAGMIGPVGAGRAPIPAATGRMAGVGCRVSSNPAVPPMITTRPAASVSSAAGLRLDMS